MKSFLLQVVVLRVLQLANTKLPSDTCSDTHPCSYGSCACSRPTQMLMPSAV